MGNHLLKMMPTDRAAKRAGCNSAADSTIGCFPSLLVSVRDASEARAALAGGADVIDIKEPAQGPLGCARVATICEISQSLQSFRAAGGQLTAALGELNELTEPSDIAGIAASVDAVKVGLSRCAATDWPVRWGRLQAELSIPLIAVAYADWESCGAPLPQDVLALAIETGSPGVLFDTYHKDGRTLLDCLSPDVLRRFIAELHRAQRFAALAGSLDVAALEAVSELNADVIAVRSAVCREGRNGTVDAELVASFRASSIRR
jgi:(5-formylfuran-3-yl)methyl phosphate synthase